MKDAIEKNFHLKKATLIILLASLSLSMMLLLVKLATPGTTTNTIMFFRFGISFLYILSIFGFKKCVQKKISLKTDHLYLHVFRSLSGLLGMFLLYLSLKYIPVVDANLLGMTSPLFIPIIALIFLHRKTNGKHWAAVLIGFFGVACILKPGHELFDPMAFLALGAGLTIAISFIFIRKIRKYDDQYISMFYFFLFSFLASAILANFAWKIANISTIILLLGIGIAGAFYQHLLILASAYAPARVISSLMYTSVLFSLILSWLFLREAPDIIAWVGIVLLILSGILTVQFAKKML